MGGCFSIGQTGTDRRQRSSPSILTDVAIALRRIQQQLDCGLVVDDADQITHRDCRIEQTVIAEFAAAGCD
jgi:hypothetical protein